MQPILFLLVPLTPALFGLLMAANPGLRRVKPRNAMVFTVLWLVFALTVMLCLTGDGFLSLFTLAGSLPIALQSDGISRLFALLISGVWCLAGMFAFGYLKHDPAPRRYFALYFLTEAALLAMCFAGTLVTLYLCFETMTLCSVGLVLHNRSREAVAAGIKYLIYSIAGAMMGLFGIIFFSASTLSTLFIPGGSLDPVAVATHGDTLLWVLLITLIGFGTKAGMFPMHGWLSTAHPAAPAPASAVLSGVIVNSGVLCVIRIVFYTVGADFLRGTWVQTALLSLTLATVLMGSLLALSENNLKKRLAYSTISQISYILFGLYLCNKTAFTGALLHVWFHSFIKTGLFLCAGAIIVQTGQLRVEGMVGIGKRMPVTLWCFTLVSVGLIGIPPLSGFVSKWFLARGALSSGLGVFAWLGPVVLLISALLTAAYLLTVSINAFFPNQPDLALVQTYPRGEVWGWMLWPMIVMAALTVALGIWPNPLLQAVQVILPGLM